MKNGSSLLILNHDNILRVLTSHKMQSPNTLVFKSFEASAF